MLEGRMSAGKEVVLVLYPEATDFRTRMPTVWREAWIGPGRGARVEVGVAGKVVMERFWRLVGWEVERVVVEEGIWWVAGWLLVVVMVVVGDAVVV